MSLAQLNRDTNIEVYCSDDWLIPMDGYPVSPNGNKAYWDPKHERGIETTKCADNARRYAYTIERTENAPDTIIICERFLERLVREERPRLRDIANMDLARENTLDEIRKNSLAFPLGHEMTHTSFVGRSKSP